MAENKILTGRIWPTFLRYSVPWALSMLTSGSAAIIDGIFIGRYAGAIDLASVNIIAPVWGFMAGVGIMLSAGGSAIAGNYLGRGNPQAASAMLCKTLLAIMGWCALFFLIFFSFQEQALRFLGAQGELYKSSSIYLRTLLYFSPVFPLCFALSYFVRLDNRPVMASMGFIICALVNVPLDWWFIGHLNLGVFGAALATGIAYCVPCLLYASHFFSPKCGYVWPKKLGKWNEVAKAAWNGSSEFINETSAGIVLLLFNIILVKNLGSMGVAAFTVLGYVSMMGGLLCYGIADALTPLVSVNNGAGKFQRVAKFLRCSLIMVCGIDLLLLCILSFYPQTLVDVFLPDAPDAVAIALAIIAAARWEFLFLGVNIVLTSYFTGRLWAAASFTVAICRGLLFPCALLGILPIFLGVNGIFYVPPVAEGLTCCVAILIYHYSMRKNQSKGQQCGDKSQ